MEPQVAERRSSGRRSVLLVVLGAVVTAGLFGSAVTLSRLSGHDIDDATRLGTARVSSCEPHGPVSLRGFGRWESCTVTVAWDTGGSETVRVGTIFRSRDIGTDVRVGDAGNGRTSRQLARAGAAHRPWLLWGGLAVGIVAFLPAMLAVQGARDLLGARVTPDAR